MKILTESCKASLQWEFRVRRQSVKGGEPMKQKDSDSYSVCMEHTHEMHGEAVAEWVA